MDACTRVLSIDNTREVLEVLEPVATRWKWIGIALNLNTCTMDVIDEEFNTVDDKLSKMTTLWLKQAYDTETYGKPTWPVLIEAVRSKIGGNNKALADEIKKNKLTETQLVATEESSDAKIGNCKPKRKLKPTEKSSTKVKSVPVRKASVATKTSPACPKPCNGSKDKSQPIPPQATKEQISPAHVPKASTTGSSLPWGPHLLVTKACRILLFRNSIYLGAIFDGVHERYHSIPVETYKATKHGATLRIVDSFGLEVREKHEATCTNLPDLVLFCLPLKFDTKVVTKERETFKKVKILLKPDIFKTSVIIVTVPETTSSSEEDLAKELLGRRANIEESFARLDSCVTTPPILCIREDLVGDISGCPESSITNFWITIFERCSRKGQLALFAYLADRMYAGHHDSKATSSLLQEIPKEAAEKAKSLIGDAYFQNFDY